MSCAAAGEISCFTPGNIISTPTGNILVEDLKVGDKVVTRDNGLQTVRWIGRRRVRGYELGARPDWEPVILRRGALGNDLPAIDLVISPNHRVLHQSKLAYRLFREREILVAARNLLHLPGFERAEVANVTYLHVLFDRHEVIMANGCWTESFQPTDQNIEAFGQDQYDEILGLFPAVGSQSSAPGYETVRPEADGADALLVLR